MGPVPIWGKASQWYISRAPIVSEQTCSGPVLQGGAGRRRILLPQLANSGAPAPALRVKVIAETANGFQISGAGLRPNRFYLVSGSCVVCLDCAQGIRL